MSRALEALTGLLVAHAVAVSAIESHRHLTPARQDVTMVRIRSTESAFIGSMAARGCNLGASSQERRLSEGSASLRRIGECPKDRRFSEGSETLRRIGDSPKDRWVSEGSDALRRIGGPPKDRRLSEGSVKRRNFR